MQFANIRKWNQKLYISLEHPQVWDYKICTGYTLHNIHFNKYIAL